MQIKVAVKLLSIGVLLIVLLVPLSMLDGLVAERQARGREAVAEIAKSTGREQLVSGPFLLIEAERTVRRDRTVSDEGARRSVSEDVRETVYELVPPKTLEVENRLGTERRRRGLFTAKVYSDALELRGRLRVPDPPAPGGNLLDYRRRSAALVLGLGDTRGIRSLRLAASGVTLQAEPGGLVRWLDQGIHAPLPLDLLSSADLAFEIGLNLAGTDSLQWIPLGDETKVSLEGDWPHPSFFGAYLPDRRDVRADGFASSWTISRLASQAQQLFAQCGASSDTCGLATSAFGVRLVDPVDRYLLTDRAIKYALLFLVLMFGAVFFVEALRRVEVHLLQYGLTGLALAMFFLLLLSLSEHIGFGAAYLIASAACVGLIGIYMAGVLDSRRRGLFFAALLSGLYGLLYGVLQSEDYALLMGTLALFGLLATVMLLTRRMDWSRMGQPDAPEQRP